MAVGNAKLEKTVLPFDLSDDKDQFINELKTGFSVKFQEFIIDLLHYENRRDFESKMNVCRLALYLAEDFETPEKIQKYDMVFKAIVYGIAWSNNWINDDIPEHSPSSKSTSVKEK